MKLNQIKLNQINKYGEMIDFINNAFQCVFKHSIEVSFHHTAPFRKSGAHLKGVHVTKYVYTFNTFTGIAAKKKVGKVFSYLQSSESLRITSR